MAVSTVAKYIRRSPYQAVSAALLMTLTFFTISVFALLTIVSVKLINYLESQPQLTAFFKEVATRGDIQQMQDQLKATGKTASITYISKDEALKIYHSQNKSDPILLELVTAEILPASLEIQATKPEYLADLASMVTKSSLVEDVAFQKDVVDRLIQWVDAIQLLGIGIISVLVVVSIFVILTIIGIKITIRREEIEILRLIGASNWFIRLPFLLEGMFYGFVGAVIGWAVSVGILFYFTPQIEAYLNGIPVFPIPYIVLGELLIVEVAVACFIGMFASYLAVLRYLK